MYRVPDISGHPDRHSLLHKKRLPVLTSTLPTAFFVSRGECSQFTAGFHHTMHAARGLTKLQDGQIARHFFILSGQSQRKIPGEQTVRLCDVVAPPAPRRVKTDATAPLMTMPGELAIDEALRHMRKSATAKFHESVDVAVRLGIDPKRSDMAIRGVTNLPHQTGKKLRVCVFAEGIAAEEARAAGAHIVGGESLISDIKLNGLSSVNFDKAVAHETMLPKLGEIARLLGRRGMMPNRKDGTIAVDVREAINRMHSGRVEFRAEKNAIVHACIGKLHFTDRAIEENAFSFLTAVMNLRPRGVKGAPSKTTFLKDVVLSSTMGKRSYRIRKYAMNALPHVSEK